MLSWVLSLCRKKVLKMIIMNGFIIVYNLFVCESFVLIKFIKKEWFKVLKRLYNKINEVDIFKFEIKFVILLCFIVIIIVMFCF